MPEFNADIPRIRDTIEAMIDRFHLPGIGLGVVAGGEMTHAEGFGWADIAAKSPTSADDPEIFAVEPDGYPRSTIILARDSGGQVDSIRLPRLVEMVRNPDLEPWT